MDRIPVLATAAGLSESNPLLNNQSGTKQTVISTDLFLQTISSLHSNSNSHSEFKATRPIAISNSKNLSQKKIIRSIQLLNSSTLTNLYKCPFYEKTGNYFTLDIEDIELLNKLSVFFKASDLRKLVETHIKENGNGVIFNLPYDFYSVFNKLKTYNDFKFLDHEDVINIFKFAFYLDLPSFKEKVENFYNQKFSSQNTILSLDTVTSDISTVSYVTIPEDIYQGIENLDNIEDMNDLEINSENVIQLTFLADYLDFPSLRDKVELFYLSKLHICDSEEILKLWKIAKKHLLPMLLNECEEKISRRLQYLVLSSSDLFFEYLQLMDKHSVSLTKITLKQSPPFHIMTFLERQKNLQELNLIDCWITDSIGEAFTNMSSLTHLNISNCENINDDIGVFLKLIPNLKYLKLSHLSKITDKMGAALMQNPSLRSLVISQCYGITDDFGQFVASMPFLEHLSLINCHGISDNIGPFLYEIRKTLLSLDLSECPHITDGIGIWIKEMEALQRLQLAGCQEISVQLISELINNHRLEYLDLNRCNSINDGISLYLPLFRLIHLNLTRCPISNAIGNALAKMPCLRKLNLSYCNITDAIGQYLPKTLEDLDLSYCQTITDDIGSGLTQIRGLNHINFHGCAEITSQICSFLMDLNIEYLNLSRCKNIDDRIGPYLEEFSALKSLELSWCNITNALIKFNAPPNLESLSVRGCNQLTTEIFPYFCRMRKLKKINMTWSKKINPATLRTLSPTKIPLAHIIV